MTLPEESCTLSAREGSWTAISSAPGTYHSEFHSSSEELSYTEVLRSLETTLSVPFKFGNLEMKASAAYNYKNQMTTLIEQSKTCSITLPGGLRLWEWTYSVQSSCGTASIPSCYFKFYEINDPPPCCLATYETDDPNVCTQPMRNMCTGE